MKSENTNKFVKGNINEYSGPKGYIIGRFMGLRGFPNQETEEVEVAWKKLTPEDNYEHGHYHKLGVEINIVIRGECSLEVNGENIVLKEEDFLIVYPESVVRNFVVDNGGVEMIIVKAPSVPDDKYDLTD